MGLVGSLLIGVSACGTYWSYAGGDWQQPFVTALGSAVPHVASRVLMVIGVALLTWAWWRLRPWSGVLPGGAGPDRTIPGRWALLGVWSLPLLLVPPVLTADPFAYADSGWILLSGLNPYEVGYGGAGGPFVAAVDPLWQGVGVAYPPLQFFINAAMVLLAGLHPYWAVIAMRIPALIGVALVAALLPRIADLLGTDREVAVWFGVLNPILVIHFVGGAHNDAIMVGVSVLAIWLVAAFGRAGDARSAWVVFLLAPVVVGIAMALKQQAGLTVIAVAGLPVAAMLARMTRARRWLEWAWRLAAATVVALVVFGGIGALTGLGNGWIEWMDQMGRTGSAAPFNLLGQLFDVLAPDAGVYQVLGVVSTVAMLGALAFFFVRYDAQPLRWLGWGSFWFTVLGSALHPWYVVWPQSILAVTPLQRRVLTALVVFSVAFGLWNAIQTVSFASAPLR